MGRLGRHAYARGMTVPAVKIRKNQFGTGSTSPSPVGNLAIIAGAAFTVGYNVPASFARDDLVLDEYGYGPLTDYASYCLQNGQAPVIPVKSTTAVAAAYGSVTATPGTGTSACTGVSGSPPLDEYDLFVQFVQGGTVGSAGPQLQYGFSGANGPLSAVQNLGTGSAPIAVPMLAPDGTTLATMQFAAGTVAANATYECFTTRPMPNNTDLPASFTALSNTRQGWEGVLIDCVYQSGTVGLIDTWLSGLEAKGQFHFALLNTRHKLQPVPTAEDEPTFAAAITTLIGTDNSARLCVGTDAADLASTLTGISQPRPTALFLAARAMLIPVGEDPAYAGRGSIPDASLADNRGNLRWHDEDLTPTLDGLRLVTLRSFPANGPAGVYITNANVFSSGGSDFVWLQHLRTMNLACTISWGVLTNQLSIGVGKKQPDPVTGAIYIAAEDADRINGLVNSQLRRQLKGQCAAVAFALATDDDLSSNSNSTVHGDVSLEALAYLKDFQVTSSFVKSISVKVAA